MRKGRVLSVLGALALMLVLSGVLTMVDLGVSQADDGQPKCDSSKSDSRGPQNDSPWNWNEGDIDIPCDPNIYLITGIVSTDAEQMVRQSRAASGSMSGVGMGSGYGGSSMFVSGSYFGPELSGKGLLRIEVTHAEAGLEMFAPVGNIVILKTTDTKVMGAAPGDSVTLKCRLEYEAVGAIIENEKFKERHLEDAGTWELDYCRLVSPDLGPAPAATPNP